SARCPPRRRRESVSRSGGMRSSSDSSAEEGDLKGARGAAPGTRRTFSAPELAAEQGVASLELVDGGAGDGADPGFAVDPGLDLAVGSVGAAGDVADQPAALGAQALAGFVGRL